MRKILGSTLILVSALTAIGTAPASADDRDILRDSSSKPYLFVILDTSGSMNWSPQCTAADVTAGNCTYRCDSGDCAVPRDGDDPASKFRQAKEALYEVLRDVDDIDLGFSTYNQDDLRVTNKHGLYRVRSGEPQITLLSGAKFPTYGSEEVFGATIGCDRGNGNDNEMGCFADSDRAADTNDTWETTKVRRLPKLGTNGSTAVSFYIRNSGQVYYVTYDDPGSSQTFGGAITVRVRVDRCTGSPASNPSNGCNAGSERTLVDQKDIKFDVIGDFVLWDFQVTRNSSQGGYFGTQFSNSGNTCASWEVNSDSTSDDWNDGNGHTYNLKRPNGALFYDPSGTANDWRFQPGDTIPLNWAGSNRNAILDRLAPRLNGGDPATDPEAFGNATYLNNDRIGTEGFLRRSNANYYPLIPSGSTPLGASLRSFQDWYRGCPNTTASCNNTGWDDYAASEDPKWGCRQKFILVLTDGDETCSGDPCGYAGVLHDNDGVSTYVIAFGVPAGGGNFLNCMASKVEPALRSIPRTAAARGCAEVDPLEHPGAGGGIRFGRRSAGPGERDRQDLPVELHSARRGRLLGRTDGRLPETTPTQCTGAARSVHSLQRIREERSGCGMPAMQEGQLGGGGTYCRRACSCRRPTRTTFRQSHLRRVRSAARGRRQRAPGRVFAVQRGGNRETLHLPDQQRPEVRPLERPRALLHRRELRFGGRRRPRGEPDHRDDAAREGGHGRHSRPRQPGVVHPGADHLPPRRHLPRRSGRPRATDRLRRLHPRPLPWKAPLRSGPRSDPKPSAFVSLVRGPVFLSAIRPLHRRQRRATARVRLGSLRKCGRRDGRMSASSEGPER
ncbi:MAG: hypothetical protein R2862_06285 [Thermoanaerobaculia bacterium]